jgi:hypothetical protein
LNKTHKLKLNVFQKTAKDVVAEIKRVVKSWSQL